MPSRPFAGQESVVPLLAEAVSQTGSPNVLIASPTEQERAKITADLKNYGTAGGTTHRPRSMIRRRCHSWM